MRSNRLALLALLAGAAALAACDKVRPAPADGAAPTNCTGCHGGVDNATGAPPRDTKGNTATSNRSVGAHTAHVDAGLDCDACHVKPARLRDPGHISGRADITFGAIARLPDGSATPAYDAATGTCSNVYCHGSKFPPADQGAATTPVWTGGLTTPPCGDCHGTSGAGAPPTHTAGLAITDCAGCHPDTVLGDGSIKPPSQGGLHVDGRVEVSCNQCHGDATRPETDQNLTIAPPKAVSGATAATDAKVGAHLRHVSTAPGLGSRLSRPFRCAECHAAVTSVSNTLPRHGNTPVVQFGTAAGTIVGTGGLTPTYTGGTCASTWCHGASLAGGAASKSVTWNTTGTAACGTCHFQGSNVATAAGHTQFDKLGAPITTNAQCSQCHPGTVKADGTIDLALGNHVNGTVEATSPHPAAWADPVNHGPAAKLNLAACAGCHGAAFDQPAGKSCNACHQAAGHASWQSECVFCHGDKAKTRPAVAAQDTVGSPAGVAVNAALAAPPRITQPNETDVTSGAHLRHLSDDATSGNRLSAPIRCQLCHGATVLSDGAHQGVGHANARVDIGWQGAAAIGAPVITPAVSAGTIPAARDATGQARGSTVSCSNYCHGASLSGGSASKTFTWTAAGSAGCGTCHGLPPTYAAPSWHTAGANASTCATCHYAGLNKALHVNGTVDLVAGLACNVCHGSAANAAPPGAASAATSATTDPRVGAHQAHVTAGPLARAFACTDCHGTLPTTPGHADGAVAISWSALASGGTSPTPAAGTRAPGGTGSCSNYCHGGKWAGNAAYAGTNLAPSWISVGAGQAACGTCHQVPPASSAHAGVSNCADCHPGYPCSTPGNLSTCTTVNLTTHVNGQLDANLSCSGCHGDPARTAMTAGTRGPAQSANNLLAMPPRDSTGATAGVRVGAHASHAVPAAPAQQVFKSIPCSECHGTQVNAYTTTVAHWGNGAQVTFSSATTANLGNVAATITQNAPPAADTCVTYCHGGSLSAAQKGAITVWQWNSAVAATCGSCHGAAPGDPVHTSVSKSAPATACNPCHATVVDAGGAIIFSGTGTAATTLHMNGSRQNTATCNSCHGSATSLAPPTATNGATATADPKVGAHQKHLTGTTLRSSALACTACHTTPASMTHASGTVDLTYGTLAATGGLTPTPGSLTGAARTTWEATPTCTNYCHGGKWAADASYRGNTTAPLWTGTSADADCGDCHRSPPATSGHASVTATTQCGSCHTGYTCTAGNLAACTVNKIVHMNGSLQVNASCTGCHATAVTGSAAGFAITRRPITPEFGYAWSHKRSANPSGTVAPADCGVCHMEGDTSGNVNGTYHANGLVNLRDPDTGLHIKQVAFVSTGASSGNASGYGYYDTTSAVDATFYTFTRDLSSSALEATVQAIMVNQCLKCHDSDGAASAAARIGTVAAKPFNTTIAGANYTGTGVTAAGTAGGVTDVNASFATSNAAYHPIRGRQNNSYVSALRMYAPWNTVTKTAGNTTSWGYVISCWDCHAPQGAVGLQTMTVTAHGGTTTLRQPYWVANATNLCTACHRVVPATGASTSTHGAGSAWQTTGNGTPGGLARTSCYRCHGSSNADARPTRPYSAQDVHGVNGFAPYAGSGDTIWPVGATNTWRPYAFFRSAGGSGLWNGGSASWKPLSGPSVPSGGATCSATSTGANVTQDTALGSTCGAKIHGTYTPGGVY